VDWPSEPCSREAWTDSQSPRIVRIRTVGVRWLWPAPAVPAAAAAASKGSGSWQELGQSLSGICASQRSAASFTAVTEPAASRMTTPCPSVGRGPWECDREVVGPG